MPIRIEKFEKPMDMEYSVQLNTDKEKEKFIKRCEQLIRSSLEYRDYIAYLKENVNMSKCAFFQNVENGQGARVRIEIHHEPLTLFDIVSVVLNKYLEEGIPINDLYIADEVMDLHYRNMVGLIPLSKSLHQIVHNSNEILIPLNLVFGNYRDFIHEYEDYLDENIINKIERKINETKGFNQAMVEKLSPKFTYINVDGFELPKRMSIEKVETA